MESREHPFSWEALTRIALMGIGILLVWKALGVVMDVIVALVLSASLHPLVRSLHAKTKLPVLLCAFILLAIILVPFLVIGITLVPNLNDQLPKLLSTIDSTLGHLPFVGQLFTGFSILDYTGIHSSDILASSGNILMSAFSVITTFVLAFYFVYDYERLQSLFLSIFPYKEKEKLKGFIENISNVVGQYIRGNVIISGITFFVVFVSLTLLKIPFALPLALFSGIFDLLPLVGSTIGSIPALLVAYSLSPWQGTLVLIIHLTYQQVENAVISPAIYNKALNLYPALGFLAVVLGAGLFGILGAFLALPIAASIPVVVSYHENYKLRHHTIS